MNPLAIGAAVVLLALVLSGCDPNPLRQARKNLGGRRERRDGLVPYYTLDGNGLVLESIVDLVTRASSKLGRPADPAVFVLASMIAQEEGAKDSSPTMKTAVAWAAMNKAKARRTSIINLLAPRRRLGTQIANSYASTSTPPTKNEYEIADKVYHGEISDPTGGARHFDVPQLQRKQNRSDPSRHKTPETIAANRMAEGNVLFLLPGVPEERLRFWRPKDRASVSGFDNEGDDPMSTKTLLLAALMATTPSDQEPIDLVEITAPEASPTDGLIGHDETVQDVLDVYRKTVPSVPCPKLATALANKWGKVFDVPVPIVRTLIDVESSDIPFRVNTEPRAMKLGGAWGFMAITYRTGEDLVKWLKRSSYYKNKEIRRILDEKWHDYAANLLDPELNVMLGTFYLARLWKEFPTISMVAAAYQAGPGAVRAALRAGGLSNLGPQNKIYVAMAEEKYPKYA